MHIVASDYDGTLYSHGELLGDVVGAVKAWRDAGNRFGIATGRDFSMIVPEIERWNIPVDFLVCINGAAVYDADRTLLQADLLPDDLVPEILAHPAAGTSQHFQLSGLGPLQVFLRPGSLFWDAGIGFESITAEQAARQKEVGQISFGYATEQESEKWTRALNDDLGGRIRAHRNKHTLDITRRDVDKASGVANVLKAKGWTGRNVSAIGDGTNDVPMIRTYNGYSVRGASEDAARAGHKQYENVPELLSGLITASRQ